MKTRLLLFSFFVFLIGFAVYLLVLLGENPDKVKLPEVVRPSGKDVAFGEIILNAPGRDTSLPYEVLVLSKVFLRDHKSYLSNDGRTPMVDLELGFVKNGEEKNLFVTMVGKVSYRTTRLDSGGIETEENGVVDVDSIEYVKGDSLSVNLEYVTDSRASMKYFENSCSSQNSAYVVCGYLPFGYGREVFTKEEINGKIAVGGTKFSPSQVLVSGFTRSLQYPNHYD
ncbi:MAG: hypothetical protein IT313_01895 [Anaerolineales bacterium]|nr:hypothetical protein [Anaerolineales bacterium]